MYKLWNHVLYTLKAQTAKRCPTTYFFMRRRLDAAFAALSTSSWLVAAARRIAHASDPGAAVEALEDAAVS